MSTLLYLIIIALFANAFVSFVAALYWQAKVILTVFGLSDWKGAFVPWKAFGSSDGPRVTMARFMAGESFPELRRKWGKAIAYVICSYLTLFIVVGLTLIFWPDVMS